MRQENINSSLHLPDKTLQFVKDHPLLEDPVLPVGGRPHLITKDVNYTQIAVDRVTALDGRAYDVIFTGTGGCSSLVNAPRARQCFGILSDGRFPVGLDDESNSNRHRNVTERERQIAKAVIFLWGDLLPLLTKFYIYFSLTIHK